MGEMKRILIVEDSPTVIEMMRLMLKEMNVKIQTAGSEFGMFQAIESFGKLADLVIMDITLKSENGLDLIAKIRENPKYAEIPVVVVTEHAQKDFILRAKSLNVKSFIRKPLEKSVFIERLEDAIGIEPLRAGGPKVSVEPPDKILSEPLDTVLSEPLDAVLAEQPHPEASEDPTESIDIDSLLKELQDGNE